MKPTKKDQIADAAMPLFLSNGFKGTSIDMVVKASGVSKPTVYNHFPDKATVMDFVMTRWLSSVDPLSLDTQFLGTQDALIDALTASIFSPEAFKLYRLVLAEGWRFPVARQAFFQQFEQTCRQTVSRWAMERGVEEQQAQAVYSDFVLARLWAT
ncbi:MAG: TetR/AcrR family transcriptional regulator [Gammaproteobacteria bacterium]